MKKKKKKQKKLTLASVDKEETGLQTVMNGGPERRRSSAGGCSEGGGSMSGSSPHFRSDSSPTCERRGVPGAPSPLDTITLLLFLAVVANPASGGVGSNLHLTLT